MRLLLVSGFLCFSIFAKSQQYAPKNFIDSLHNVEMVHLGKEFAHFNLKDINGNFFSNSCFKTKITLVNFWFESCSPCIAEFKPLNEIFERFHNNNLFSFITFTFESPSAIDTIIKKYSLKFTVIPISQSDCYRLNFNSGFPTSIIIDKQGKVAFFKSGGATEGAKASQDIDSTILPKLIELLEKNN